MFVLEVIKFIEERHGEKGWEKLGSKYLHQGYMNKKFRTRKEACKYYRNHNPHMREITEESRYRSDWDPETKLLYIVREDHWIHAGIPAFE